MDRQPARNLAVLRRLFTSQCRSFAQYMGEAWPWEQNNRSTHDLLRSILADEKRWAGQLAEIIVARGGQPIAGNYPDEFVQSNLHFVAMDYLMQRLADDLDSEVATLRAELAAAANDTQVQSLIEQMIERKAGQVDALRKLAVK